MLHLPMGARGEGMLAIWLWTWLAAAPLPGPIELKPFDPVDTSAGKLLRREVPGEEHPLRLLVGDRRLYERDGSLELAYLVPQATSAGGDAVLIAVGSDLPAEKSCTRYAFVVLAKEGPAPASAEFGDCTDQFAVQREGTTVTVRFAAHDDAWALTDGKLAPVPPAPKKPAAKSKGKPSAHPSK
jgi:hypothetical protein